MAITLFIFNIVAIPLLSPLLLGVIRKMKARIQSRVGASVFQPYRDLIKLFRKDEVVSEDASWVFDIAPYIVFGSTLALSLGLPLISIQSAYMPMGDILVFIYVIALGTFFLALSGFDTGGGFGGFGASREMMFAALTEGGLILSLAVAAILAGSANLSVMSISLAGLPLSQSLPFALAAAAFFIALLAENARYPVDNPATHLELTMVHEAMILEYSGPKLALMEWASSNKLLIFSAVFAAIFMPWGLATELSPIGLLTGLGVFAVKVLCIGIAIAFIESVMAKFRIFRVPDLLFTSFVLSAMALLIIVI